MFLLDFLILDFPPIKISSGTKEEMFKLVYLELDLEI